MSLKSISLDSIPEHTARIAQTAFPKGNTYLKLRDQFGSIYEDADFNQMFPRRGRPAESPARLALVVIFQFLENLSDRAASEAVRARIDWKYALGLDLDDAGFDASILTEFRLRLIENEDARILFEKLLEKIKAAGLVKTRGRQRTDPTRVLGSVHDLNRLECVWEAMRGALNGLAQIAPDWLTAQVSPYWFDRYARRLEGFHWSEAKREAVFEEIGNDGWQLLEAINRTETTVIQLSALPAVEVLRRTWVQQFSFEAGKLKKRQRGNHPPSKLMIRSPFDVEMRLSRKREQEWQGYKVHLTETIESDGVQLITDVQTTAAADSDKEALPKIQARLSVNGLLPETQIVDAGYVTAAQLVESRDQYQIDLLGPLMRDPSWQAKAERGFAAADFTIDWGKKRAICPQGKMSSNWQPALADYGMELVYIHFLKKDCSVCPAKNDCTKAKSQRRTITVNARPYHEAMQTARQRQTTEKFKAEYQKRSGIEGTISQGVRAFGLRKARYRGLAKTSLQHYATATAMNIARLGARWAGVPREKTRISLSKIKSRNGVGNSRIEFASSIKDYLHI